MAEGVHMIGKMLTWRFRLFAILSGCFLAGYGLLTIT